MSMAEDAAMLLVTQHVKNGLGRKIIWVASHAEILNCLMKSYTHQTQGSIWCSAKVHANLCMWQ